MFIMNLNRSIQENRINFCCNMPTILYSFLRVSYPLPSCASARHLAGVNFTARWNLNFIRHRKERLCLTAAIMSLVALRPSWNEVNSNATMKFMTTSYSYNFHYCFSHNQTIYSQHYICQLLEVIVSSIPVSCKLQDTQT